MEKEKQIVVNNVELITSGVKDGREWKLYKVISEEGEEFTTFDTMWLNKIGQAVLVKYKEIEKRGTKGRVFINKQIIETEGEPKQEKTRFEPKPIEIKTKDQIFEEKLDKILKYVQWLVSKEKQREDEF